MSFWSNWSDGKKWIMGIIAALMITAMLSAVRLLFSTENNFQRQEVVIFAQSPPEFAIQSLFQGTAFISGNEIRIELDKAVISYPKAIGDLQSRYIESVRVLLANIDDRSWNSLASSSRMDISRDLYVGTYENLGMITMRIHLKGTESLSGSWLVFEIEEGLLTSDYGQGSSYAHTRPNLF